MFPASKPNINEYAKFIGMLVGVIWKIIPLPTLKLLLENFSFNNFKFASRQKKESAISSGYLKEIFFFFYLFS